MMQKSNLSAQSLDGMQNEIKNFIYTNVHENSYIDGNKSAMIMAATDKIDINDVASIDWEEEENRNLSATITSIRSNVTKVLDMYFKNVSDEFGYGAATTTTTTTTPSPYTTLSPIEISTTDTNLLPSPEISNSSSSSSSSSTTLETMKNISKTFIKNAANYIGNNVDHDTKLLTINTTAQPSLDTPLSIPKNVLTTAPSITYPTYRLAMRSHQNCSDLFANYTQPQQGECSFYHFPHFISNSFKKETLYKEHLSVL